MNQELLSKKKEIVKFFIKKKLLLEPTFISKVKPNFDEELFYEFMSSKIKDKDFLLLSSDLINAMNNLNIVNLNWFDMERSKVLYEKNLDKKTYPQYISSFSNDSLSNGLSEELAGKTNLREEGAKKNNNIKVVFSYDEEMKKKEIQDFVDYFNARYDCIKEILGNRQELKETTSINKLRGKKDRSFISIIGFVLDKVLTKNKNYILTLEDSTGTMKVLVNKNKPELYNLAREIVLDEVIGVNGVSGDNIIFANKLLLPDVPMSKEMKRANDECYVVFLSDLHVGSSYFLPKKFDKFLKWIRGEEGNSQQKEISSKVRYIFIIGDIVDGVGIYPEQDSELDIKDIYNQYEECAKLLKKIPSHINIIICPGNHDAMRIAEPQPPLYKDFTEHLWQLPNITMVSNPSIVNIHSSDDFSGFDILMYHGYSFDYFVANVDTIREQGGYDRADLIMKFLLQRRHLAPTHTSTLYIPDNKKDPLVINKIPDFFVTGHIHKAAAANYRNITMICGSCWQSKTSFQEKVGHNPEPARVPIVNLQTRQVKILRF